MILLENLWEITIIYINIGLIITLTLVKLIPPLCLISLKWNKMINRFLNKSNKWKNIIINYPELLTNKYKQKFINIANFKSISNFKSIIANS